jgi:hypothetical protein
MEPAKELMRAYKDAHIRLAFNAHHTGLQPELEWQAARRSAPSSEA